MASETQREKLRADDDGVKILRTPEVRSGIWLLVIAVGLAGVSLLLFVRPLLKRGGEQIAQVGGAARQSLATQHAAARPAAKPEVPRAAVHLEPIAGRMEKAPPAPAGPSAASDAAPAAGPAGPRAATNDDAARGDAAAEDTGDEPSGIALFPPPGTNPPKSGIIVPDDFELPQGYMRHYQSTDDGERLAPILVFHPDFQLVDDNGKPLPMPADGVVAADMAPPGLAVEMLHIPDPQVDKTEVDGDPGQQDAAP
jgi:hypothetical protein